MWISVRDKETILPSTSKVILVTDGQNYQLVSVEKFLETVDTPYNTWTHWMKIPKVEEELVSEEELDKLAETTVQYDDKDKILYKVQGEYYTADDLDVAFKAGYREGRNTCG